MPWFLRFVLGSAIGLLLLTAAAGISAMSRMPRLSAIDFAQQATVLVSDDTGHGSGTVIAPGVVLTAGHVVGDRRSMKITLATGVEKTGTVIWANRDGYDLALISVPTDDVQPAQIDCQQPRVGEPVFVFGYPLAIKKAGAWGHVSSTAQSYDNPKGLIVLDLHILPGNSGGGVWGLDGRLVGTAELTIGAPFPWPYSPKGFIPSLSGLSGMIGAPTICTALGRVA